MKNALYFIFILFAVTLSGCYTADRILYKNLDHSGYLSIGRYTTFWPSLGPCGFSRDETSYDITTPRISGRIESSELTISCIGDTTKCKYSGHVEFISDHKVFVDLYATRKGIKTGLIINGLHTIKVEDNKIGDKKI